MAEPLSAHMVVGSRLAGQGQPAMIQCRCGQSFRSESWQKVKELWAAHRDGMERLGHA